MPGLRAVGASNLMALQNDTSRDLAQCPETGPGSTAAEENGSFRILHGPPGGAIDSAWRSCLAELGPAHALYLSGIFSGAWAPRSEAVRDSQH